MIVFLIYLFNTIDLKNIVQFTSFALAIIWNYPRLKLFDLLMVESIYIYFHHI